MSRADLERLARDVAQPVERHRDVLAERAAALREDRERRAAAPAPQLRDVGGILRRVHRDRVLGERLLQLAGDPARLAGSAVGLRHHHERAAFGDAERIRVAGERERDRVEVLDRRGNDTRRQHALDRADPGVRVAVEADDRKLELGRGNEPQPRGRDEAERPLGADDQALQVVRGDVLADRAADVDDLARAARRPRARSPSGR